MRLLIYSDIHLEWGKFKPNVSENDYDIVMLAGDIAPGKAGVAWAGQTFNKSAFYVAGNHEFYGRRELEKLYGELAKNKHNVEFLHNDIITNEEQGIRILGCTLWTDFALDKDQTIGKMLAKQSLNDYVQILDNGVEITPHRIQLEHYNSLYFLREKLATKFNGKTVVMTHHAPSAKSIDPSHADSTINHCYASNLDNVIEEFKPDLWIHGHVHCSNDYLIGRTRVVSNPRGYVERGRSENPNFKEDFIIDI
jgi:Icc-related predicted phosphoesterase